MPDAPGTPAPPTGALSLRDRLSLTAVLMAVGLASLDTAIANTALPAIAADLQASAATSIWVINAFQLAVVASLLPCAALGDRFGPRRVFIAGLVVFTVASLACALAGSLGQLAVARAVKGVGAGALMSVNIALVRLYFPPQQLGRGMGLNALTVGVAFAAGPTVASLVLSVASWPWLFWMNVPLGLLALALAWPTLPHSAPRGAGFDAWAALLTAGGFAALIFALAAAAQHEPAAIVLPALLLAVALLGALLRHQAGHPAPMLPVDLLRRPLFALSAMTSVASFAAQGLAFVSLPFFFEQTLHRNPIDTGFLMAPWAIVVALAAPVAGRLSDRYPPGLLCAVGLALLSAGLAALALLTPTASVADIVWRMALCGIGFGLFQSPNLNAIMSSAPPQRSGSASGMIALSRLLGQTTGAALVALCFGLAGTGGPVLALGLGAGCAALAALASGLRLRVGA